MATKAVVTPKNQHLFVALAELMDENHVSAGEFGTYKRLEEQYAKASKLAKRRKKAMEARLARIVHVTLGIKDMKEFKLMSPKQVEKLFDERYSMGEFTLETPIVFRKKSQRSRPSYQDVLRELVGDAGIIKIQEEATVGYSYTVDETVEQ